MQTKVWLEADFESHGQRRQRGAGKQKWRWIFSLDVDIIIFPAIIERFCVMTVTLE
jgi:hypothetical protein